jgi:hypothetical protein
LSAIADIADRNVGTIVKSCPLIYEHDLATKILPGSAPHGAYPTEQFPVGECQQTLHMSTSNKMAMALERIRQQQQQVFIGVLVDDFVLCACI